MAGILITSEAAVADAPKKASAGGTGGDGMGDMVGMDFRSTTSCHPGPEPGEEGGSGDGAALFGDMTAAADPEWRFRTSAWDKRDGD